MPKVLLYKVAQTVLIFLFYGTDLYENRAHVHVGKPGCKNLSKIWLEPEVIIADHGDLTAKQAKQASAIATKYREELLKQWNNFKKGKTVKIIKINN